MGKLKSWAAKNGFDYMPNEGKARFFFNAPGRIQDLVHEYSSVPGLDKYGAGFYHWLRRKRGGHEIEAFGYEYKVGGSARSTGVRDKSAYVLKGFTGLPEIKLVHLGLLRSALESVGGFGSETGDPDFDRAFRVDSENESGALEFLTPEVAEILGRSVKGDVIFLSDRIIVIEKGQLSPSRLSVIVTAFEELWEVVGEKFKS